MSRFPVLLLAALALVACDTGGGNSGGSTPATAAPQPAGAVCQNLTRDAVNQMTTPPAMAIDVNKAYTARMTTSKGSLTIALNPKVAPTTVNNFVCLARQHYYDKLTFHRWVEHFVIQGGDPLGSGVGGPAYKLPDETNSTPWRAGSVAMASNPKTGVSGSQFFIVLEDGPSAQSLATSGVYNQFGSVTDGLPVVLQLRQGDVINSIDITEQ